MDNFTITREFNEEKLNETSSALALILFAAQPTGCYAFYPGLNIAFRDFVARWQNPADGWWGQWLVDRQGKVWKMDDVSMTFHMISDTHGQVPHLDLIAKRLLKLDDVNFPAGVRFEGHYTNHLNWDAVKIFRYAWPLSLIHIFWQPFGNFPMHTPVNPDAGVYGIALLLTLLSGCLFGSVPVGQVLRASPYEIVKAGSSSNVGRWLSVRDGLLVLQIAICAVLVTSSLVAVRGMVRTLHGNFGFDPRNSILVSADLHMAGYTSGDRVLIMQRKILDAVEALPGVESAGLTDPLLLNDTSPVSYTHLPYLDAGRRRHLCLG